ncbi:hypothetical protein [Opitutus sp. ER46]|uniref:hypothetical protein n=1 Tax=Opitutus sp. ER46 TaxID=2161864 RepID=UPI000D30E601|nr:hypothetical protein [Opitutus sp. ER46]PTX95743.1 hypothetical protein DB354_10050 [Opitutus sp. ER46]
MITAFIITACLLVLAIVVLLLDAAAVRAQRDAASAKLASTEAWFSSNLLVLRLHLAPVSPEVWGIAAALDRAFRDRTAIDLAALHRDLYRAQRRHDADLLRNASQLIRTENYRHGGRS